VGWGAERVGVLGRFAVGQPGTLKPAYAGSLLTRQPVFAK
jgi:hypothetical protein